MRFSNIYWGNILDKEKQKSPDSAQDRGSIHPLLIPEVIETISRYSTFSDLKTIRRVCYQWKESSLQVFKSRAQANFYSYDHMSRFVSALGTQREPTSQIVDRSLLTHVRLSGMEFQEAPSLLRPFLFRYGHEIRSLEIDHGPFTHSADGLRQFLRVMNSIGVPNLETVVLRGSHIKNDLREGGALMVAFPSVTTLKVILEEAKDSETGISFFRQLFRSFPNLDKVVCTNYQLLSLFNWTNLDPMTLPRRRITDLHVHVWNSIGVLNFVSHGYMLRTLKLNVAVTIGQFHLHKLIESQGETLQHLELYFPIEHLKEKRSYHYAHNSRVFPSAPHLKVLEYLRLIGYCGDLYFLKEIPTLQRVDAEFVVPKLAFPQGIWVPQFPEYVRGIIRLSDPSGASLPLESIIIEPAATESATPPGPEAPASNSRVPAEQSNEDLNKIEDSAKQ